MRAYGRAANMASCARRSLAAETIFIAFVICCVLLTLRIRRRMSIRAGMCALPLDPYATTAVGWNTRANSASAALSRSVSSPLMSFFAAISCSSEAWLRSSQAYSSFS